MISKVIHYIWLGDKKLNNTSLMCINSCRRICSDYEIVIWENDSLNLQQIMCQNDFLKECVEKKLWAFASDYLRLYILYHEGGIYLDTDVEIIKPFDDLLGNNFFVGLEQGDYIGTGVIGAEKGSTCVRRLLDFYDNEIWNVDYYNNPIIFKELISKEPEKFCTATILPIDYFAPYNPFEENPDVIGTTNTICIHWYNASWGMSRKGYVFLNTKHFKNPFVKWFQKMKKTVGYYRKRKHLNV